MPERKIFLFLCFLLFCWSGPQLVAAGEIPASEPPVLLKEADSLADDQNAILNVLEIIEQASEEAEDTRLNLDYVPGMMTVLWGDDLEEKGAHTVYEALSLIPGLHLSINDYGVKKIMVRGLGLTYCTASLKLLLNSVSTNNGLNGIDATLYDMPVEQVERIEVIRGPGSVLFGENAYAGVINVITRKEGGRVFGRLGRFDTYSGGAVVSYSEPESDFSLTLNMAGWETSGAYPESGPDRLAGTANEGVSNAPGPTNEALRSSSAILSLDIDQFSLLAQYLEVKMGDYFGFGFTLGDGEDSEVQRYRDLMLEAGYTWELGWDIETHAKLGWMKYVQEWDAELAPAGYEPFPGFELPDGMMETYRYTESRLYGGAELTWTGWPRHTWLAGMLLTEIRLDDYQRSLNTLQQEFDADVGGRQHLSLFGQDQFEITDRLTLTAGLRYDTYDDAGDNLTPRLAAVYRFRDRHILKTQYAQAFRPPTFTELYGFGNRFVGNQDIVPETIDTFEFGYIYKGVLTDGRLTLFYSKLEDLIAYGFSDEVGALQYANSGGAEMEGVELEIDRHLTDALKIDGNISYVTTKADDTGEEIPGAANWLGNAGLTYTVFSDLTVNLRYQYVGASQRDVTDNREELQDYETVDVTASLRNMGRTGLTLRAGINNLFDQEVVYPSTLFYQDDFPRAGIQCWGQLSYSF